MQELGTVRYKSISLMLPTGSLCLKAAKNESIFSHGSVQCYLQALSVWRLHILLCNSTYMQTLPTCRHSLQCFESWLAILLFYYTMCANWITTIAYVTCSSTGAWFCLMLHKLSLTKKFSSTGAWLCLMLHKLSLSEGYQEMRASLALQSMVLSDASVWRLPRNESATAPTLQ